MSRLIDGVRLISPTAILGYGFPAESLHAGSKLAPEFVAVDGGSTDPGPYYLGSGKSFTGRSAVRRDLELLMGVCESLGVPLVVGSAGGAGGDPHVEWCYEIVESIARERGYHPRVALIHSELDPKMLEGELEEGRINPLGPVSALTTSDLERSRRIVGQMGVEPIQSALGMGADIVIAGRSCDVSPFAAIPISRGCDPGSAIHAAKILECGAYCAEPAGASDSMFATIYEGSFVLKPLNSRRRATRISTAAHSLYEQEHPFHIVEPLGMVDVSTAVFEEHADGSIRISGSRFIPAEKYTIKIEAAASVGFRAVTIAGIRDDIAILRIDDTLEGARAIVTQTFGSPTTDNNYRIHFRVYGRDGVMGEREPLSSAAHEIGVLTEVVAESQAYADEICSLLRSSMLHFDYPGRRTVGGSLAIPFSPHDCSWGEVFEFSAYHLWEPPDPLTPFPVELRVP